MLKKAFRIPARETFKNASVVATPFFILKYKVTEMPYRRFGVVISKKVEKRAVYRNRMRRVLMSIIEEHKLYEQNGYDMLFILKQPLPENRAEVERLILDSIQKTQRKQ